MIRVVTLLMVLLAGMACGGGSNVETENADLANGFYLVTWWGDDAMEAPALRAGGQLLEYRYQFLDASSDRPLEYLVVDTSQWVPLMLSEDPVGVPQDEEKLMLRLKLEPSAAERLEDLTRENLGRNVTIIIGGEVITTHTIRSVIENGDVQISRCDDNACEFILAKLVE